MEAKAVAKHLRITARKARLVTDLIKGKDVNTAVAILKSTPKKAAKMVEKVLNSATANAENNHDMFVDDLYVKKAFVDEGPTMKRWKARAQGSASPINKRTSHITIVLSDTKEGQNLGNKINPHGLRVGVIKDWDAKWYADKTDYAKLLNEDREIRNHVKEKMFEAGISRVVIERAANRLKLDVHTARPGMVIGRGGSEVEALRNEVEALTGKTVQINVVEVSDPEMNAQLVAENIASQLVRRISFRRAMKQAMNRAMRMGAEGFKVQSSGRLGGAEMARREGYSEGSVPMHTLRADIDYGFAEADTTYGTIGVKVWINKGEILPELDDEQIDYAGKEAL